MVIFSCRKSWIHKGTNCLLSWKQSFTDCTLKVGPSKKKLLIRKNVFSSPLHDRFGSCGLEIIPSPKWNQPNWKLWQRVLKLITKQEQDIEQGRISMLFLKINKVPWIILLKICIITLKTIICVSLVCNYTYSWVSQCSFFWWGGRGKGRGFGSFKVKRGVASSSQPFEMCTVHKELLRCSQIC